LSLLLGYNTLLRVETERLRSVKSSRKKGMLIPYRTLNPDLLSVKGLSVVGEEKGSLFANIKAVSLCLFKD